MGYRATQQRKWYFGWATIIGLGVAALWGGATPYPKGQSTVSENNNSSGSLHLVLRQQLDTQRFAVDLLNVGLQPLILHVGIMLANGREQFPNHIKLRLAGSNKRILHLQMKVPSAVVGRLDPMVVPLPVGVAYTVPIDLRDYFDPTQHVWSVHLSKGDYSLQAEYAGTPVSRQAVNGDLQGIALMPYWTGHVQSETIRFAVR